jgi:hypothetical protein
VAALVVHLEAIVDHVLLAELHVVRDRFAGDGLAPAAFIQGVLGVDETALVLEEPLDAVERTAAFLVGGERNDEVAVRLEPFALEANEIGDPDRGLGLIVACAAAVEVAVLLDEGERVHAPVFALRLDDVRVGEQQERRCLPVPR